MKTTLLIMAGAAILAASSFAGAPPPAPVAPPPPADDSGWFVGAKGGFFWLQDESFASGSLGADVQFSNGWGITVPVGYNFGNGWSAAFTAGYYEAGIDSVTVTSGGPHRSYDADGEVQLVPLMANAAYNIKLDDKLYWYLGAGLGAVHNEATLDSVGGSQVGYEASSWDFGFQGFTGLRYDLCPNSSVILGYRFLYVDSDGDEHIGHSVEIGVAWRF